MKNQKSKMMNEYRPLFNLWPASWAVFIALCAFSLVTFPFRVFAGVAAGGLLVLVSFHFINRVLIKGLQKGSTVTPKSVLPKYYLRFFLTVVIIFILISQRLVSGLGLILGFSTFIITVFSVLIMEMGTMVYKKISKEAA